MKQLHINLLEFFSFLSFLSQPFKQLQNIIYVLENSTVTIYTFMPISQWKESRMIKTIFHTFFVIRAVAIQGNELFRFCQSDALLTLRFIISYALIDTRNGKSILLLYIKAEVMLFRSQDLRQQLLDFWRGSWFGSSAYGDKFNILPGLGKGSNFFNGQVLWMA